MKYFLIKLKVCIIKDIPKNIGNYYIAKFVDNALRPDFEDLHNKNCFKNYVISDLFPGKKEYKAGEMCSITVRTINESLKDHFLKTLPVTRTEFFTGLFLEQVSTINENDFLIQELKASTPVVVRLAETGDYWKKVIDVEKYLELLKINLIKKYNSFFTDEKLENNFELFTGVNFINPKPLFPYVKENIKICGDRMVLSIANNSTAQKLAFLSLGVGLGELNSRGFGYLSYKKM